MTTDARDQVVDDFYNDCLESMKMRWGEDLVSPVAMSGCDANEIFDNSKKLIVACSTVRQKWLGEDKQISDQQFWLVVTALAYDRYISYKSPNR